ncbi:hypothetical protein QBC34DRAFT_140133 [Podospora aff. communis PSN243]|uniref:Methyltransferase domain-containing protein n=1 Tax=Podospora aff. communis PSN243 TaxID=3040156 RepID=A0AAV9H233_9PEZI|nr:hypothetical protein QBC34DRAFT_140133 [Podospora aff. communis PSN243]
MPLPLSSADKIAAYAIHPPNPTTQFLAIEHSQAVHRINLINEWDPAITTGTRILELGCGQGTCTQALAHAVSPSGHITAIDPASPDYGAPFTLAQAQSHLSSGALGPLITFERADPVSFLNAIPKDAEPQWDVAVLAHCIWYFPSASSLDEILSALRGRVKRVCIAEWALQATELAALAHVLAALARATCEAHRTGSKENIQTTLSPRAIREAAVRAGWKVEKEGVVVPVRELSDGFWEVGTVVDEEFLEDVEREVEDERVKAVLRAARDATVAAAKAGVGKVRSMDVWVATLVSE